jgi:hypothetical protein
MGTTATIAIKQADGDILLIDLQQDGYPEHAGAVLQKHYNTTEKIEELLSIGMLKWLGATIGECEVIRLENGLRLAPIITTSDFVDDMLDASDFSYFFIDGEWFASASGKVGELLTDVLKKGGFRS